MEESEEEKKRRRGKYIKKEVKEESCISKVKHQEVSKCLTWCVVLRDSEGVQGGSRARAIREKSDPLTGQL